MAPVGQALAGQLPPQAVIYRDTCCHRNDQAGAPLAHLSCGHASTGWGEAPLGIVKNMSEPRQPVIAGGARTPVGRLLGSLASKSASELGGIAIAGALDRA